MRILLIVFVLLAGKGMAQMGEPDIREVLGVLASDSMMGREAGSVHAMRAAGYLAKQFESSGLRPLPGQLGYLQSFEMVRSAVREAKIVLGNRSIDQQDLMVVATEAWQDWNSSTPPEQIWVGRGENLGQTVFGLLGQTGNKIVFADSSFRKIFARLRAFPLQKMRGTGNIVVVLTDAKPEAWSVNVRNELISTPFANVGGLIEGKRKEEYVIFSAHYDHLGAHAPRGRSGINPGDTIYNGANDDASGTTAVVLLARHFASMKKRPARSLIFVAFTAEESGGYGSSYFSKQLPPEQVVAMFNIEMIGTESKWGKNSAYITGYEQSDFGKMLQQDLKRTPFEFHPDPYPDQNLFYRSDNATLARLGVPAHTISTSKMDSEVYYHTVDDEIETLDLKNMAEIIRAIALSSKSIVTGKRTPSRVSNLPR